MPLTLTPRTPGTLTLSPGATSTTIQGSSQLPILFSDLSSVSLSSLTLATRAANIITTVARTPSSLLMTGGFGVGAFGSGGFGTT